MSSRTPPPPDGPGTLTSLLEEVFRGSGADPAWAEGLAPGSALGRYDLIREIGRGGFSVVWEARDRELGRRVAIKVMRRPEDGASRSRLVAEAEVAARLSHPGIVTTLDVGHGERGAWLVQELLVGQTLSRKLAAGPLPLREAVAVAAKVADALAYAHRNGVVHRDLSTANVFLCDDGQVKLLDLGMAQAFGRRRPPGGTPEFMAPEQALGEPEDERVDVYALGVLLYRMLTGRSPVPAETPPGRRSPPLLMTQEAPALGALVNRMLSPEPRERPRDGSEVLAELEGVVASLPRSSSASRPGAVRIRRRRPRWGLVLAGAAALLGGVGLGAWVSRAARGPEPAPPTILPPTPTSSACQWSLARWVDLDRAPEGALLRNGESGGQGVAEVAGRKAWRVDADWGQVLVPVPKGFPLDTFAIEAQFHLPEMEGWDRGAVLDVMTNPVGGPRKGELEPGIHFKVWEAPGKPARFRFGALSGDRPIQHEYIGSVGGPVTGGWHTLRVEGSRSRRWFRGLLDGQPLVVAFGDFDLSGAFVVVGAGYGAGHPEGVAWSNLRLYEGNAACM